MRLFKLTQLYIKISTNNVEITNLKTDKTLSLKATKSFSTKRIILGEFNVIENLIRDIIKQLIPKILFPAQMKVLIQQVQEIEEGLTEIEKRALRDLGEQSGGNKVKIIEHFRKLSSQEALLEFNSQK